MLIRLQQLWLSNNKLRRIPDVLHASLERLLIDFNLLEVVSQIRPKSSQNQLNTLSLTGNAISNVVPNAFSRLLFLDTLRLDFNQMESIDGATFSGLSELRVLQISNNPLRILGSGCFQNLGSLESLYISDVATTNVSIHEDVFEDLSRTLVLLDLSNSPKFINKLFSIYFNQFVQYSSNQDTSSNQGPFSNQGTIINQETSAVNVLTSTVRSLNKVASPDQRSSVESSNHTRSQHSQKGHRFSAMTELSLYGSELTGLRPDLPNLLPQLLNLRISSSSWHCNESLSWFPIWISSRGIILNDGGEGLNCLSPLSFIGKSLLDFSDSEFPYQNKLTSEFISKSPNSTNRPNTSSEASQITRATNNKYTISSRSFTNRPYSKTTRSILQIDNQKNASISNVQDHEMLQGPFEHSGNNKINSVHGNNKSASVLLTVSVESSTLQWSDNLRRMSQRQNVLGDDVPAVNHRSTVTAVLNNSTSLTERSGRQSSFMSTRENGDTTISFHTLVVLTVTVLLTVCAAVIIIVIIIYITKRPRRASAKNGSLKTAQRYESKTSSVGSVDGRKLTVVKVDCCREEANKSTVDVVSLLNGGVTVLGKSTVEVMALVPGRDVNHEGPRRVYKWEDF